MEIPYSMARRLPPCHCPEEGRDIVQPLRPYLPLMLSLRDQIIFALDEDRDIVQSTLSPSHAQSEEANSLARRLPSRKRWLRNFAQDDKWNFCLTAGTLVPGNQEKP